MIDTLSTTKREVFIAELTRQYTPLFATDPDYAHAATHTTPEKWAVVMADGLPTGICDKDGKGVRAACRALGIKCTYKAIGAFLAR